MKNKQTCLFKKIIETGLSIPMIIDSCKKGAVTISQIILLTSSAVKQYISTSHRKVIILNNKQVDVYFTFSTHSILSSHRVRVMIFFLQFICFSKFCIDALSKMLLLIAPIA